MGANGVKCRVPECDSSKRMATIMEEWSSVPSPGPNAAASGDGGVTNHRLSNGWRIITSHSAITSSIKLRQVTLRRGFGEATAWQSYTHDGHSPDSLQPIQDRPSIERFGPCGRTSSQCGVLR
jgi:hypothetical protein